MKRKILSGALVMLMLVATLLPMQTFAAEPFWNVKISNEDYNVDLDNTQFVYICNKKSIGTKVGTEYYMTYTVESMKMDETEHQGVCGTTDPTRLVPFETGAGEGGYYYHDNFTNKMLQLGKTYFLKFVITEDGFDYRVGWAEGEKSRYIEFGAVTGDVKEGLGYFGLDISGSNMTGRLTKVRCYDKYGNDLGVQVTPGRNATVSKKLLATQKNNHVYKITLRDASNVIISNRKLPKSTRVYMEYKVVSSDSSVSQSGVIHSNKNQAFPFDGLSALLYYKDEFGVEQKGKKENGILLDPGASYIIEFEMTEAGMSVIVQKTKNGVTSYLSFPGVLGSCPLNAKVFSLWFGQGDESKVNCVLDNFKCYDSNGNNLSVQCNQPCQIIHYGGREDYSGCEAIYYCDEDETLYALYANQNLKYTEGTETKEGSYVIDDKTSKITITVGEKIEEYDYRYQKFSNEEGKTYRRLQTYRVTFVTGTEEQIEEQVMYADTGYVALRPMDPVSEGRNFMGWYTSDGEEYDFDKIVTESLTLYAKWDESGEYVNQIVPKDPNYVPYIAVGIGTVCFAASLIASVVILKRRRRTDA